MFVSMQVQGQLPEGPMREHLERRLRGAVSRYGERATGIALRATTAALDRVHCRVSISLDAGVFTGAAKGTNVYFAAEEALAKATRNADKVVRRDERRGGGVFLSPSASGAGG